MASALRSTSLARTLVRSRSPLLSPAALRPSSVLHRTPLSHSSAFHSTTRSSEDKSTTSSEPPEPATTDAVDPKVAELTEQLEQKSKMVAELKDARLRSLADFENLQKISAREKVQAKDYALTSFARDLIASVDILSLALSSIAPHKLVAGHADAPAGEETPNPDLVNLHQGVEMTQKEVLKVLKRHGVVPFDPTGEAFDPNRHEALYQAPVPGKEPGTVLETQEVGYMIKDRLLRPAKVGVVLSTEN